MTASKVQADRGRFRKGRSKTGGRRQGTPNRATRAWKDFVAELVNDPEWQQRLAEAISEWAELLFNGAEHAVGRPRQLELAGGVSHCGGVFTPPEMGCPAPACWRQPVRSSLG